MILHRYSDRIERDSASLWQLSQSVRVAIGDALRVIGSAVTTRRPILANVAKF
jgi:hypothetical protein